MISGWNEQLQQEFGYTLLKPDCHSWWISKIQSDTLEGRYTIKFCFKLGKMPQKRMECFGLLLDHLAWIKHQFLRFKEDRESVRNDERCGRSKEVNTPELIGQRKFRKRFCRKRPALFKSRQWHFHQDNAPVHNSIPVTDYLTKMGIKTVPQPPYSPDLTPCNFCLFPKLRSCQYETIEGMKEAVMKVIDMLTQEDFHEAFQKLLERCNKCITAGGDYFEGD